MQAFLNRCAQVEDTLAAIYRGLAATVAAERVLRDIWLSMAEEEDEHGREIHLAKRLVKEEIIAAQQLPDAEVRKMLSRAGTLLEQVRSAVMPVREALRLSLHLEEDFRQVHVLCAVHFADHGMRTLFERLGKADQEHVARLTAYCRGYQDPPADGAQAVPCP